VCFLLRGRLFAALVGVLLLVGPALAQMPGLGSGGGDAAAEAPDRSSPQMTLESFMTLGEAAAGDGDWLNAAQCLNVPEALGERAAERAKLLHEVLVKLDPKPMQALDESTVESAGTEQFQFFPQDAHHGWVAKQLPSVEKLSDLRPIVLKRQPDNTWLFSEQTVQDIPALAANLEALQPQSAQDQLAQVVDWLGPTFERTEWQSWGAFLMALLGGLLLGKVVQWLANRVAGGLEQKEKGARATVFRSAANPASLALLTLGLTIGTQFIYTQGRVAGFLFSLQQLLYTLAVGWFLYNLVDVVEFALRRAIEHANQRKAQKRSRKKSATDGNVNEMIIPLIRKTLRIVVAIILLLTIANNVFGWNITGLIAGLGVAGLAISLAAQESVKNVFGSLTVFFDKPFVLGDFITFGSYTGIVEDIGFRSTRLRLLNGNLVTVPNMKFIDGDIENIGARPYIRRVMDITITYDTPPAKIEEAVQIVKDLLNKDEEIVQQGQFDMNEFPPRIAFDGLNSDSLNIKAYYWYQLNRDPNRGYWTYLDHCELVNRKVVERFEAAGIEFAFPTQTLYLAGDQQRQLDVNVHQANGQPSPSSAN
jgi:MscS family membrane protein